MIPKISFVMPTHNNLEWIGESLQGLLSQTIKDIEIVVVNDASNDGTKEFLDEWASKFENVKIIHNEKQMGAGKSRNIGMEAAQADIIGVCDSDDIYPIERAEMTVKHFEEHPESELVNFPTIMIGYCNERIEDNPGAPFDHEAFLKDGAISYFSNPSCAFKKNSAKEVGGYEPETDGEVKETDDIQFLRKWVKAGKKVDFQPLYALCYHRTLPGSMMSRFRGWDPKWASKQ